MNYKIVDKESFKVVGKQRKITMVDGENFKQVPEFWHDCMNDGSYDWISIFNSMLHIIILKEVVLMELDFENNVLGLVRK